MRRGSISMQDIPAVIVTAGRRLSNATAAAGRRLSDAAIVAFRRVRWTVTTLTTDAYFFGNLTFFATMLVYVVFDVLGSDGAPEDSVRDMLLVQAIIGILSAISYLLVWYGGEPLPLDLTAEGLNVASAVWYTLVVLLERYAENIGLEQTTVNWLEVSASLFFLVEATGYGLAWFYSLPPVGTVLSRLFQWDEVYFWGHLLNVLPALMYVVAALASALPFEYPRVVESGRLPLEVPAALWGVCVAADAIYLIDSLVWMAAWRSDLLLTEAEGKSGPPDNAPVAIAPAPSETDAIPGALAAPAALPVAAESAEGIPAPPAEEEAAPVSAATTDARSTRVMAIA